MKWFRRGHVRAGNKKPAPVKEAGGEKSLSCRGSQTPVGISQLPGWLLMERLDVADNMPPHCATAISPKRERFALI